MTKKKVLAIAGVLGIAALVLSAGTLAYFTDTDEETNTFTIGNVKIDLIESQIHRANPGSGALNTPGITRDGTADNTSGIKNGTETAYTSGYVSDATIKADADTYKTTGGYYETNAKNMVPGSNVRKAPYVINTGKNDAYIRVRVLIPKTLFTIIDNGPSMWTTTAMNEGEVSSNAVDYYLSHSNTADESTVVTREGVDYYEFDFTYTDAIKPEEMTFWNVWGNIAIDKNATSADLANVICEADAIQADGFANATAAFEAFDQQNS